jgi:hypothetical protein
VNKKTQQIKILLSELDTLERVQRITRDAEESVQESLKKKK